MASLALNLLALVIVVGMCWIAMMWLSGRFHGHANSSEFEFETVEHRDGATYTRRSRMNLDGSADLTPPVSTSSEPPCVVCDGVGAQNTAGKLAPCPECYGTGVLT